MPDRWQLAFEQLYPWKGTMPVIEVSGEPYRLGREQGEQTRPIVKLISRGFIDSLCVATKLDKQGILKEAHRYEQAIQDQTGMDYIEEMHGLAAGAAVPYEDILVLNCGWDLLNSLPTPETHPGYMCSSLSAWGPSTADGRMICGHNDDGARYIDQFLVLLQAHPSVGHDFVAPLVPGYIGYHRMWNDQGVVLLGLSLENGCRDSEFEYNMPMWVLQRYLTQTAGSTADAITQLKAHPPATAFNFLFADRTDSRIIEATAKHQVVISPPAGEHDLVLTNHALSDNIKPALVMRDYPSSTHYRYQTVSQLLSETRGTANMDTVKAILSSHFDASVGRVNPSLDSPCRHGEYEGKLTGTVSSIVIEILPDHIKAEISLGNPCENRWVRLTMPLQVT